MIAAEGEEVSVGKEDPETPKWFWCKDSQGIETWIHSSHIDIEGSRGKFNQDYNSVDSTPRLTTWFNTRGVHGVGRVP